MNIFDFERHTDQETLKRAYKYFDDGAVEKCSANCKNKIHAAVFDKEQYFVEIILDRIEIMNWSCDCLVNKITFCRHVAAVLYKIREEYL